VNCYVLVGGRSTRFGSSKANAFLERVVAAARPVFDAVLAVQRPGGEAMSIPTIFEEPHDGSGPIFGLVAALRHAKARCFILAVDYPFVTSEVLSFLRDDGRVADGQPLCAVWDPRVLPELERRIAETRFDLHGLWEQAIIDGSELRARFRGEPLKNVNRPEDLRGD
jgi:molybdopterin-guanine dinucleotide biosynthesis protein A